MRYDRLYVLTCAQKLTQASLIYCTITKKQGGKTKKNYKIETDMVAAGKSVESVLKKKREGYGGKDL